MSRSLAIAVALSAATALIVAALLSLAVPPPIPAVDAPQRAESALALALASARWQVEAGLAELRRNAFLQTSLEDGDEDGVRAALASSCADVDCALFDEDGDAVASIAAAPAAGSKTAGLPPDTLAPDVRAAADQEIAWIADPQNPGRLFAVGRLGADEGLGYVRIALRIDLALLARATAAAETPLLVGRGATVHVAAPVDAVTPKAELSAKAPDAPLPREAQRLTLPSELPAAFKSLEFHTIPPPRPNALPMLLALTAAALAGGAPLVVHALRRERQEREAHQQLRQALKALAEGAVLAPIDVAAWRPAMRPIVFAANTIVSRAAAAISNAEAARRQLEQRIERVSELLQIEDGAFAAFLDKVAIASAACQELVARGAKDAAAARAQVGAILRALHTVKSSARLLGLSQLEGAARDAEDAAAGLLRGETPSAEGIDTLASQLHLVEQETLAYRTVRERVLGETRDGRAEALWAQLCWLRSCLARTFGALREGRLEPAALGQLYDEYRRAVASMGKEDLAAYVRRYDAMLHELAERAGKKLAPLTLTGNGRFFDREVMRKLDDVLLHALRNALDHGVEAPIRRKAAGKPETASIAIESYVIDRIATVVVRDDGRGLDRSELIDKLTKRGLGTGTQLAALTDAELYDRLFATGEPARAEVGELSGRGVGLDALREIARGLGGEARIAPRLGAGTEVVVHFPVDEAASSDRLSIVSLEMELQRTVRQLDAALAAANTRVEIARGAGEALVTVDRVVFRAAVERLLLALARRHPKPLVIDAAVEVESRSRSGLETYKLRVTPRGAPDTPFVDEAVEELLLEGGMALLPAPGGGGVELLLPSGLTPLVEPWTITVVALSEDHDAVSSAFAGAARGSFRSLRLETVDAMPPVARPCNVIIAVLDEEQLVSSVGAEAADVIVVSCREIGALRWDLLAPLAEAPILAQGTVDAASAREALDLALLIAARRAIENLAPSLARVA